ncbi:MAG: efflux RND transporter periplasmic adaptor subunit [Gammaproteobacteria bacterium]
MRINPVRHIYVITISYSRLVPLFLFAVMLLSVPQTGISEVSVPVPVYVVEARIAPVVENLPLTGTVTSERSAALSPRVSGLVSKINVDAGDHVLTGDVLLEMDTVLAKLALNQAQAALDETRTALKEAVRLSDEARNLAKDKNIPETIVQSRIADVEMKKAAVTTQAAEYKQQAAIVNRHTVIAPFDGAVSKKLTEVGEWVQTGTPVINLIATDQLRLDVQVPQEYFHLIRKYSPVIVKFDAAPGKEFISKVLTTVPVNSPNARTFLTRIELDNTGDFIIPGMSAQAIFNLLLEQEALQLPRDATIRYPDGRSTVWVITEADGQFIASEQQIQLGRSMSNQVIVRKGLNPGSIVVVAGNETLQEGQVVQILKQTTADKNN